MDDLPIEKIAIPGPTLASLIQRFSTSPGPIDGLLFGHVSFLTPSTLSDDPSSPSPSSPTPSLVATITSFLSSSSPLSFYSPSGVIIPNLLPPSPSPHPSHLLGWFSARRRSPLRPSLRESSVSSSLSSLSSLSFPILNSSASSSSSSFLSPCLFLLLASPIPDLTIHTHEYRAYQFHSSTYSFLPKSIDIVNIGPAFRGHYGAFSPNSPFPSLPCELRSSPTVMIEDNLNQTKQVAMDQRELDMVSQGFEIGTLSRLMGSEATTYTAELESLYENMLSKIHTLATQVEQSSAKVLDQENHNRKLRYKVARFPGSE